MSLIMIYLHETDLTFILVIFLQSEIIALIYRTITTYSVVIAAIWSRINTKNIANT